MRYLFLSLVAWIATTSSSSAFVPLARRIGWATPPTTSSPTLRFSTNTQSSSATNNNVVVVKEGGRGVPTAGQQAAEQGLTLGAPPVRPQGGHFLTKGGVQVTAHVSRLEFSPQLQAGTSAQAIEDLVTQLDSQKGVLLTSSYEFPGRYARWSLGFVDPPLEISGRGQACTITALNARGRVLMPAIEAAMKTLREQEILEQVKIVKEHEETTRVEVQVVPPSEVGTFNEEERSRQPSLFSVVRALVDLFSYQAGDRQLGLYGAFGYDLTFQFEPIDLAQERDSEQRDLLLYLPDTMLVVDQDKRDAWRVCYDFNVDQKSTQGIPRTGTPQPFQAYATSTDFVERDTPPSEFANSVLKAKEEFKVGNLFEAVLSQTFREKLTVEQPPSTLFRRLRARNPAPYGFLINLGEQEYLVGASPEMFVRCEATNDNDYRPGAIRVETCPISGTVARGADALEDAQRVKSLMMNAKEESELTMCTDVDRNDKSRICEPGSVQVIGRRQIEMYSRLIHTVDHVEGYLRPEFDALDAFLCHTWAVTVTGAPKTWAIQFVEVNERSPRCWYGGAVGMVGFDGGLNTGLTLRTVRVKNGIAEVRAGATLLFDSEPEAEEKETELKASAMIDAIVRAGPEDSIETSILLKKKPKKMYQGMSLVLIDHEDSFVHTLGNYLRQTGAQVTTLRSGPSAIKTLEAMIANEKQPDLVVLSPGPGNPSDFGLSTTISFLEKHRIAAFGVCLGLQGMVEHFGGTLGVLSYPMHGKPSTISLTPAGKEENSIFTSLPDSFEVARYHSLHGIREQMPSCLEVTATSEDGVVMGIQHKTLPFAAVQFHPESILTSPATGMTILQNALTVLKYEKEVDAIVKDAGRQTGSELVGELEKLNVEALKDRLETAGLLSSGSKSDLVVKLALWTHKSKEANAGRLNLEGMTVIELKELKNSLGIKGSASSKIELLKLLKRCLQIKR
jgi:anthranilate synthase